MKSVLLDLDGTLVDSQPGIFASCAAALRALGHDPGDALEIKSLIGPPLEEVLQILLQARGDDRVDEAVAAYRHHYGESGLLASAPYPGIGDALEAMRQAGLRIYLATSKREVFARRILENLELAVHFDGIYGGAHAVNMRSLGVLWGYGSRNELEAAGADQLVERTADLPQAVLSMLDGDPPRRPGESRDPSCCDLPPQ